MSCKALLLLTARHLMGYATVPSSNNTLAINLGVAKVCRNWSEPNYSLAYFVDTVNNL